MTQHSRSVQRLVSLAILLVAFGLRVYRLDGQSLWYDEAVTAQVASHGIAELTRWTADDIQPPLYYYAVAGWTRLAGQNEWALRFPSAFFGALIVPMMWAVARRLFGQARRGRIAALFAALLAGVSPLYVYYAQEARMYTMLTFLGLLAGYALLRASEGRRRRSAGAREQGSEKSGDRVGARWWAVFVLASVAMLYTHYFGGFLLLAYGACWLVNWLIVSFSGQIPMPGAASRWVEISPPCPPLLPGEGGVGTPLPSQGGGRGVGGRFSGQVAFLSSVFTIILLYLPWLPAMLNRYQVDRSYWHGALKLNEALRHVAISFATGAPETMLEANAVRLLPWFGAGLLMAVIALLWQGSKGAGERRGRGAEEQGSRGALALLLVVLLVPVVAILLLASRTPKFNTRYLMLASPAYLLILAGGVGALSEGAGKQGSGGAGEQGGGGAEKQRRITHHAPRNTLHALRITLVFILSCFLLGTSLLALHNWFTDPAFTKAQWRELVATVRAQIAPDEAVLLVSGHASPAWDYYAPDIPRARLPDIDILDVNAVLGFDAGAALAKALAGKSGAWLVTWQDDVVDPVGFVPYFLDRAGTEQPVGREFWHLGLRHWRLRPDATFPTEPQPTHVQDANFDHKLELLGWDDPQDGKLTVYWRTLNALPADYRISLTLEDAAGQGGTDWRWDGRPAGYNYPTDRWQPGQALFGRYPLPLPPDAPAGEYFVTLAVYDEAHPTGLDIRDVADNPAGKRVRLGPMRIVR